MGLHADTIKGFTTAMLDTLNQWVSDHPRTDPEEILIGLIQILSAAITTLAESSTQAEFLKQASHILLENAVNQQIPKKYITIPTRVPHDTN
jgi:hypothetical protein